MSTLKTAVQAWRGALMICALVLTNLSMIDSAHAYRVSVDARAAIRGCSGTVEINFFAEIDGAVSKTVQANSGICSTAPSDAASAFAEADLGARSVRTFNTSTSEGFSDAYAEINDIYYITGAGSFPFVDIGLGVSFTGTVTALAAGEFTSGRLLGRAGQFTVDTSLTGGGTFSSGGIQRFTRRLDGSFNRIDTVLLIDSIGLFGAGTVDFSNTGSIDFDLSLLPAGVDLISESGYSVRTGQLVIPIPGALWLMLSGIVPLLVSMKRNTKP